VIGRAQPFSQRTSLRDRPGERPVALLFVKPGQFSCGGDHCSTVVKFDDAPIKKFVMLHTDGDSAVLWFYDSRSFIEQLKTAKHLVVEADFYQAGPDR
jgi:hypothetical protein